MKTAMAWGLVLAVFATAARADDKPKDDKKSLEGAWTVTKAETGGTNLDMFNNAVFTFKGDKLTVQAGDESREGTFKTDPKKNPPTIEVHITRGGGEGQTFHSIYELKGDELKIAAGAEPGSTAPGDFKSKEGVIIFTLKRKTI